MAKDGPVHGMWSILSVYHTQNWSISVVAVQSWKGIYFVLHVKNLKYSLFNNIYIMKHKWTDHV